MGKEGLWLVNMPADQLAGKLKKKSPHARDQALRYFLECEQKGRDVLKRRRRKIVARLVLRSLEIIDSRIAKDEREKAVKRVKRALLQLVIADA